MIALENDGDSKSLNLHDNHKDDSDRTVHINDDDAIRIALLVKQKLQQYSYVILRNDVLSNEESIMNFYSSMNESIGIVRELDRDKYNDEVDDYWVRVEYQSNNIKTNDSLYKPWKSNQNLSLHTDNTLTDSMTFADITELVCIQPSKYSGETVFIDNNKIIEIVKYMDSINGTNLFNDILNTKIYHKHVQKSICYNNDTNEYTFNFNITQIIKSTMNDAISLDTAKKFAALLENIMNSSLIDEVRLNNGDAILFNDTRCMHGRRFIFGDRLYKKCSIFMEA